MKLDPEHPTPVLEVVGKTLEITFALLVAFVFYAFFDWVIFPEQDRPWRAGQK